MSKKPLALAPVLVTVAFAMAPAAAQAVELTWFSNGAQIPQGVVKPTVTWGDLSLKGAVEINCHNDIGGTVENPVGGGAGIDKIYDFSAFRCTSPSISCPVGLVVAVEPRNLPWSGEIIEVAGRVRNNATGVKVKLGCRRAGVAMGTAAGEGEVIGTNVVIGPGQKQAPLAPFGPLKGTNALNPGKYSYDAGSGELEAEGSGGTAKGITEGELKTLGYNEQELVQVKPHAATHIMVIVEENRNRSEVIGNSEMPYFNSLATNYENTTSWNGVGHPSLPNYLALISGSTQGQTEDATNVSFSGQTLGSQLTTAGVTWKAYMEGMPEPAYEGATSGEYAKKHNPFAYFPSTNGPNVVPGSQYATDLAAGKLPNFVWYTPDLINDGHERSNTAVDASLKSLLTPLLASAWYKEGGIVIITWDEDEGESLIPVIVVSGSGCHCIFTAHGNHYGTLAAIEDAYGLPLLGNAAGATPLATGKP